jgi:hypothetical protein
VSVFVGGERRDCRRHAEHGKGDDARKNPFESVFHCKTSHKFLYQPDRPADYETERRIL